MLHSTQSEDRTMKGLVGKALIQKVKVMNCFDKQ